MKEGPCHVNPNALERIALALESLACQRQQAIHTKLDHVIRLLEGSRRRELKMGSDLSALQSAVEENTAVDQSAIVLLNGLAAKIEELKNDPVKLQEFADTLQGSSAQLAAAVAANTPAAQ